MKSFFAGVLVAAALAGLAASAVFFGGHVPIAAVKAESTKTAWLIHKAYENAVERHAQVVSVPEGLGAEARVLRGAYNFQAMCTLCHTPPGMESSVQAQGMNPRPPELAELVARRTPAEAFWVIQNGVRMTAMPAFGPTHDDEDLWAMVAFLSDARASKPQAYAVLVAQAQQRFGKGDGHQHSHGETPRVDSQVEAGPHGQGSHGPAGHHNHPHAAATPANLSTLLSHALAEGDKETLASLLASDVLIFESGGVERGFAEYAAHHMPSDMAFLREIRRQPLDTKIFEFGDLALVASRARLQGEFKDRPVDLMSTESLLLRRLEGGEWQIQHIHWSSGKPH